MQRDVPRTASWDLPQQEGKPAPLLKRYMRISSVISNAASRWPGSIWSRPFRIAFRQDLLYDDQQQHRKPNISLSLTRLSRTFSSVPASKLLRH